MVQSPKEYNARNQSSAASTVDLGDPPKELDRSTVPKRSAPGADYVRLEP